MAAGGLPTPDYTDIRAADTRLAWLQRTDLAHYWIAHPTTGEPVGTAGDGDGLDNGFYFCLISESEFQAVKPQHRQVVSVWPGIDNVTLGTPVALAPGVTIPGPMHGILLDITAVPPGTGAYQFDGNPSYIHLGAATFVDDNDNIEQGQGFQFASHILCPKSMAVAASAVVRCKSGTVGTVTPWLAI